MRHRRSSTPAEGKTKPRSFGRFSYKPWRMASFGQWRIQEWRRDAETAAECLSPGKARKTKSFWSTGCSQVAEQLGSPSCRLPTLYRDECEEKQRLLRHVEGNREATSRVQRTASGVDRIA